MSTLIFNSLKIIIRKVGFNELLTATRAWGIHLFTHSFDYCLAITSAWHKGKYKAQQALRHSQAKLGKRTQNNGREYSVLPWVPMTRAPWTPLKFREREEISGMTLVSLKCGWQSTERLPEWLHELCYGEPVSQRSTVSVHKRIWGHGNWWLVSTHTAYLGYSSYFIVRLGTRCSREGKDVRYLCY